MAVSRQHQATMQEGQQLVEKRGWTWYRLTEGLTPYLLIGPLVILIGIFIYWPLIYSSYLSLLERKFVPPDKDLVGWKN